MTYTLLILWWSLATGQVATTTQIDGFSTKLSCEQARKDIQESMPLHETATHRMVCVRVR